MAPPNLKPNSWKKFSRLALDITAECGYELRRKKRGRNNIGERGASANLDYEPIIFESFGGIKQGGMTLLSNLCEKVDAQLKRRYAILWSDCLARLSFDLQRGLHGVLNAQRKIQMGSLQGAESLEIFLHLCLE